MRLVELLPLGHIVVPLEAKTLTAALEELVAVLNRAGVVRDIAALESNVRERRGRDTLSVGGVALPHYRTHAVDRLVVALGIASEPLERDERTQHDPGPRVVALILAPPEQATLYLQTISALARLLRQEGVFDRLLAAAKPADVLTIAALQKSRIQPTLTVRDIMTRTEGVAPDMPVSDAVDLMIRHRVRAAPVLNEKQEVLGIISEWDVMRGLLPQIPHGKEEETARAGAQLRVRDIMTRSVLCVSEDMGIEEAASMMVNKDVEQFPVVSEGKLTGFLTRSDIIRKLFGR